MMNSENEVLEAQLKISFYFMKKSCSDPDLFIIYLFIFIHIINSQKQPSRGFKITLLKSHLEVAKQLCWNHTSAWVFSCKFTAYFQKPFPESTSGRSNFESCDVMSTWSGILKDTRLSTFLNICFFDWHIIWSWILVS